MEDSQHLCPDCGADYVEAVVNDIASGAGADSRLMLASLEEGLAGLDAVPLPALGDTARKMLPALCAAALTTTSPALNRSFPCIRASSDTASGTSATATSR